MNNPKIVIEVARGQVISVYYDGPIPAKLEVYVVDLDGVDVGEETEAVSMDIESLSDASDIVRECFE